MLSLKMMQHRWPHGDQHMQGLLEGIATSSTTVFSRYGLTTQLTVAHAMAQFSEECGQGLEMLESLNYSAEGLLRTFPTHFTPTMAERWQHNPQMIGEIVYGNRMGNAPPPSTDGYDFRGAGLSQVTGRDGVTHLRAFLAKHGTELDLINHRELLTDPAWALECGVADWVLCGCLPYAERDDIEGVTRRLNGGLNGIEERKRQLLAWKADLNVTQSETGVAVSISAGRRARRRPS
jgi:putative chitinase